MEEKLTMKQLLAILAAGLFSFCGVLIETATNITFPTLMNEFQVSTSLVQWMTTGNLLMMGILIPILSYLKRRFQTKKLFLVAGFLFSIGLIVDIFAQQFTLLLIGRLIQGAGVGVALPMMYNIILEESPQRFLGLMMWFFCNSGCTSDRSYLWRNNDTIFYLALYFYLRFTSYCSSKFYRLFLYE